MTGLKLDAARKRLQDAGFRVADQPTPINSYSSKGAVVGTTPKGTTIPGSIITINTSNGIAPAPVYHRLLATTRAATSSTSGGSSATPECQRHRDPRAAADHPAGRTATATTATAAATPATAGAGTVTATAAGGPRTASRPTGLGTSECG